MSLEQLSRDLQALNQEIEEAQESELEDLKEKRQQLLAKIKEDERYDEIKRLASNMSSVEQEGGTQTQIRQLIGQQKLSSQLQELVMELHLLDHPEHEKKQDNRFESKGIDQLVDGAPRNESSENKLYQSNNPFSDSKETPYKSSMDELYAGSGPGGPKDETYKREPAYKREEGKPPGQEVDNLGRLKIGDSYIGN